MHHKIVIEVDGGNPILAIDVRDEVSGAIEDFIESHRPAHKISVSDIKTVSEPTPHEVAIIEAARRIHANHSDDGIEIHDNAIVSHMEDGTGYFVQAFVWVGVTDVFPFEHPPETPAVKMGYAEFKAKYIEKHSTFGLGWTMGSLRRAWIGYQEGTE